MIGVGKADPADHHPRPPKENLLLCGDFRSVDYEVRAKGPPIAPSPKQRIQASSAATTVVELFLCQCRRRCGDLGRARKWAQPSRAVGSITTLSREALKSASPKAKIGPITEVVDPPSRALCRIAFGNVYSRGQITRNIQYQIDGISDFRDSVWEICFAQSLPVRLNRFPWEVLTGGMPAEFWESPLAAVVNVNTRRGRQCSRWTPTAALRIVSDPSNRAGYLSWGTGPFFVLLLAAAFMQSAAYARPAPRSIRSCMTTAHNAPAVLRGWGLCSPPSKDRF
jgi:hypothetical protein